VTAQLGASASAPAGPTTITIPADSFNPPSGVTATAASETVVNVSWTDNATTENGEELEMSSDGGASYSKIADIKFYQQKSISITELEPGTSSYRFRLKAYKEGSPRTYTAYSTPPASATTPFYAPTSLTATPLASGTVNLAWTDNSGVEGGYFIYFKKNGAPSYTYYGYTASNATTYAVTGQALAPGTAYQFQVTAAYQAATLIESAPSNTANAITPALQAPTGLAAGPLAPTESNVRLTFTDNATNNTGYEVSSRLTGAPSFNFLGFVADLPVIDVSELEPGTSYDYQIRAYHDDGVNKVFSTPVSVTYISLFHAPTAPVATVISDRQINLSWTDNSLREKYYAIYIRLSGSGSYEFYDLITANSNSYSVMGLWPKTAYDFAVVAAYEAAAPRTNVIESAPAIFTATTRDGFTSAPFVTFGANNAYSYTATTSSAPSAMNIAGLPGGMNFNTATGQITGTPTAFGLFNATLSATFAGGWSTTWPLTLRVVRPPAPPIPVPGMPIAAQTLTLGGSDTSVLLTGNFSDPDSESAVRVITNLGTMDFILYNTATPQTVSNFLNNYVNSTPDYNYNGSVFHRSVPGFVVQGGAFKVQSAPNNFSVSSTAPIVVANEPGISNLRGTVAMAKQDGNSNSATNQFFVNLADNSSNLNFQNGGFTAFARVANGGMGVADAIAAKPRGTYNVNLGSTPTSMENWPLTSSSVAMDTTKVVTMTSVAPVAVLSYSIFSNSNPAAVQATVNGANLVTHALSGGQSSIIIRATDLDGNYVDLAPFTVTVSASANAWAASQGLSGNDALPDADPDFDGKSNFHEFAFMSLPNSSSSSASPSFATTPETPKYGEITFPVRKFTTGLTYIVEASDTLLPGSWTTVLWTSTDGFLAPNVIQTATLDQPDRTIVTIRDTVATPPAPRRFLRVRVTAP
jgi:cyclophilin family peptidyl-prolyl cis-trans isomerase